MGDFSNHRKKNAKNYDFLMLYIKCIARYIIQCIYHKGVNLHNQNTGYTGCMRVILRILYYDLHDNR